MDGSTPSCRPVLGAQRVAPKFISPSPNARLTAAALDTITGDAPAVRSCSSRASFPAGSIPTLSPSRLCRPGTRSRSKHPPAGPAGPAGPGVRRLRWFVGASLTGWLDEAWAVTSMTVQAEVEVRHREKRVAAFRLPGPIRVVPRHQRVQALPSSAKVDLDRDRAMVLRFQSGDPSAFDELVRLYRNRLCRYCRRALSCSDEAEAVVQETLIRAWIKLPGLGEPHHFYPWILVIAQRLCMDENRKAARFPRAPEINLADVACREDSVAALIELQTVADAMTRLSELECAAWRLHVDHRMSAHRIAGKLGLSRGKVESLLRHARRKLRMHLMPPADVEVSTADLNGSSERHTPVTRISSPARLRVL